MSGRRLVLPAGLAAGLILCTGCQSRPNPGAIAASPTATKIAGNVPTISARTRSGGHGPVDEASRRPAGRAGRPALRISPETFTITADDPGLQLLAARNEGGLEPRPDVRGRSGRSSRQGLVELEPGGYLRPIGHGRRHGQGRARRPDGDGARSRSNRRSARSWDFAEDIVPDLHPAGLQHGRVPRQGRRPEWLSSLALRLRPGRRLSGPGA